MTTHELICIQCPLGCALTVTVDGDRVEVSGNTCPRGAEYGRKEVTAPTRTVTSTVAVTGGVLARLPVKTRTDVPKQSVFAVMQAVRAARVTAPVTIGQTIIENVAGTGVDLIATRSIEAQ